MEIDILTLFPGMFAPLSESIVGRARERGIVALRLWDIREFATDRHKSVDDAPFGGGGGMVMKPEPIFEAHDAACRAAGGAFDAVLLMSPQGRTWTQEGARRLAGLERIMLICGHYEGVDERVSRHLVTEEVSIGDYVLTGGELPAMVVVDSIVRLLPGALGNEEGAHQDSFASGLLEHPHYTRPRVYRGWEVPEVLLSGDHERIRLWRRKEALRRTLVRRPDLLDEAALSEEDRRLLGEVLEELRGREKFSSERTDGELR